VRVSADPRRQDPLHAVTDRIDLGVAAFAAALAGWRAPAQDPDWLALHREADETVARTLAVEVDADAALDEPTVCRIVSREIPADASLFLGASMPVRDMDAFADPSGPPVAVGANRGASGIDGTLASACGHATGSGRPVVFVCGDLALLHDLSSLALLRRQDPPVIVVLINNDGGGIFSFLPVAGAGAAFETCFGTPQGLVYADIARAFGIDCHAPATRPHFVAALRAALAAGRPALIEVRTERDANLQRHRAIHAALRAAAGRPSQA
jgi:2-succinyl-5-enolpyruvyl-6-hydroxy-3-cyclohexene-1-carboxylate synthase